MSQNETDTLRSSILISALDLKRAVRKDNLVLLDVRFWPDGPDGRDAYRDGHIPGAVYVDLPTELAREPKGFAAVDPCQRSATYSATQRSWGVNANSAVVVYDDNCGLQAARAWWVLRWAGLVNVRLLDGGLAAWKEVGGTVTQEVPRTRPGDVDLSEGHLPVLDADEAASLARSAILLEIHGGLTPMSAEHGSRGNQRKGISPEPSARRRQVTSTAADDWQTVVTCASVSPHWA